MPTFLSAIDLNKNELQNARIQNLATAPISPVTGQVYYNTTDNKSYYWDGTIWQAGSGATGTAGGDLTGTYPNPTIGAGKIVNAQIADSTIALIKLAVDPLARANHTGTQLAASVSDFDAQVHFSSLDQLTSPAAAVSFNSQKLTFLAAPAIGTDAANKAYVDSATTGAAGGDLTGSYPNPTIGAGKVTNAAIADATIAAAKLAFDPFARDGHTGTQLAATISDFDTQVHTARLDQLAVPTAPVSLAGVALTNVLDPVAPQDAATKSYVDASSLGLDVKVSVRAATTADVTLSGPQTIDGVSLVAGDRVLVKAQSTAATNGIYVVAAGAWSRAGDADTAAKVSPGLYTFIEEGATSGDAGYLLTTDNPITLGTTDLVFTQFSGAGQITAGAGLTKTGNSLDIGGTLNRISVSADGVDISTSYVGQSTIDTLGTIATGTWAGTTVALNHGGTGATTAVGGRTALGATGTYTVLNGGTDTDVVVHGLNTLNVVTTLRMVGDGSPAFADFYVTDANTVTVKYGSAVTAGLVAITVIG